MGMATQVDVMLLNPLDPRYPSFVLAIFPQNGPVDNEVVSMRWSIATDLLERQGLAVLSYGGDGDPAQLKAMKDRLANSPRVENSSRLMPAQARDRSLGMFIPDIHGGRRFVSAPARWVTLQLPSHKPMTVLLPELCFQDFCHKGVKLTRRFLGRNGIGLRIGSGLAAPSTLVEMFSAISSQAEATIGIRRDDLDPKRDPMNVQVFFFLLFSFFFFFFY